MTVRTVFAPSGAPSIRSLLIPRPLAWLSVDDDAVCLLEGFSGVAYTPPSLMFCSTSLPPSFYQTLKQKKVCSLSSSTVRESDSSYAKAMDKPATSFSFNELGLKNVKKKEQYPVVVETSPIHMFCELHATVPLTENEDMVVLTVETFVIDGSIQSVPTKEMKKRPGVVSKIDADMIKPIVSMGGGRFTPMKSLRSMPRPKKGEDGAWSSKLFDENPEKSEEVQTFGTVEWSYKIHGGTCPLGYNATTALIMPRSIGWISTFSKNGIPHLAPYSFSVDVADSPSPHVAFSAYRKEGSIRKDAHLDAEETGCFVYNMVEEETVVAMNYSAAELGREESEFDIAKLVHGNATKVTAPTVANSRVRFECEYVKTVDVASFSIVIGKVVAVDIDNSVLLDASTLNTTGLRPITRLGYMDEYGVF